MQICLRRYGRHLGVAVLLLALAACGPEPAKSPTVQVSPYADVQFELVDELCDLLDHNRLMDLAGSTVTMKNFPHRPGADVRKCSIGITTPEHTSVGLLQIHTSLRSPKEKEEEGTASPRGARWSPMTGVGDSAKFQYSANEELFTPPPPFTVPVRQLSAWLITDAGNATISLHLMLYADIAFDRGEIEKLLSEYAREALELMRV
ncbi:MAG TPA: hypothetical protein VFX61_22685 [Micromonosporaceae bacterium]|nr:hypothetical protein [Micromonosporaceae bacterium]